MTARATARTPADTTASTATVRAKVAPAAASDGAATKTPRVVLLIFMLCGTPPEVYSRGAAFTRRLLKPLCDTRPSSLR